MKGHSVSRCLNQIKKGSWFYRITKASILIAIVSSVLGCISTRSAASGSPANHDFESEALALNVDGLPNEVIEDLNQRLASSFICSRMEVDDTQSFIVTCWETEPLEPGGRRLRRVAYRYRIDMTPISPKCSRVTVCSLVQSRGIHEELWQTTDADKQYRPLSYDLFTQPLFQRRCSR
jgi:hypothetical protein